MYEEQVQQPQPAPYVPYTQPSIHMSEGLLQQQIDSSEIIEEIKNNLQGRFWNVNPKTGDRELSPPNPNLKLINEKGLARLSVELHGRINKIFMLSILEQESIEKLAVSFAKTINRALFEHWDEWEIPSTTAASQISGYIVDAVFATLQKAYMGRYLRSISTSQTMSEVQHTLNQQTAPTGAGKIPLIGRLFRKD